MYAVTGATGRLGRLAIAALVEKHVPAADIVAIVRDPAKAAGVIQHGVIVRRADYDHPQTLGPALAGIDKLLLISASEVGKRLPQHHAVIDAAKTAGVKLVAYTSILRADTSTIALAEEHRKTEAVLKASGVPCAFLRNGWYTENYTALIPTVLEHGVLIGSSGAGRISAASRADYAEGAAAVLVAHDDQAGRIYELAGDGAFTRADLAAELSRQTGKRIEYRDLSEIDYKAALITAALPEFVAALLAQSDAATAQGALFDSSGALGTLIGRPTTSLSDAIAAALRQRA